MTSPNIYRIDLKWKTPVDYRTQEAMLTLHGCGFDGGLKVWAMPLPKSSPASREYVKQYVEKYFALKRKPGGLLGVFPPFAIKSKEQHSQRKLSCVLSIRDSRQRFAALAVTCRGSRSGIRQFTDPYVLGVSRRYKSPQDVQSEASTDELLFLAARLLNSPVEEEYQRAIQILGLSEPKGPF